MLYCVIALGVILAAAAPAGSDVTMDTIRVWMDRAGLKYQTGTLGGKPCYVLPFEAPDSTLDRVDVAVVQMGERGQYLAVYAKVLDMPADVDASVYRQILQYNASLTLANFALIDDELTFVHKSLLRLVDEEHLVALIYDVAQFVDNNHDEIEALVKSAVRSSNMGTASVGSEASGSLVADVQTGVVQIIAVRSDGHQRGSGFLVTDRFILTSRHVVEGADKVWAVVSGRSVPVEVVTGPRTDVDAVLLHAEEAIPGRTPLDVAASVESGNRPGEDVWILGFPNGDPNLTVTRGLLAGFTSRSGVRCIKTTAVVARGNSGGPVVNADGEVIGVLWRAQEDGKFSYAIVTDEIGNLVNYARTHASLPWGALCPGTRRDAAVQG